ncbi:MAG TPA: transglutaminase domain-containing protein [Candidatus Flavonifractor merdigallinarum]|uniref:Transglutaminase domain-containing protein n=1 Tax=Candidatus Flavonifractor merdigallinarum TaxID=2838589 RepID=A0A9D2BYJ1_9FIRM|nr:transglutaminase domain-containing protein [Candidatus Flavonifractor merdigallinarum]
MNWSRELRTIAPEHRKAMEFLRDHLPESDLDCYPFDLFLEFAGHAMMLRETAPWCAALDEELFFHYVLFPRVNDEDLSFHRALFHRSLWPRVKDLPTVEEKVLEVNRWCHENASYQCQDDRTASPLTVFQSGSGRCGEESAFLVSALRSVGIAARQVYSPRWAHCDDNHAWVEALCGDTWRFLGACEPEPILDRGWFNTAASRAILVHSRLFGRGSSPLHGTPLGTDGAVTWYNQTARYARTRRYTFRATLDGAPAAGAVFRLQVLNEASYHTIATLIADEKGEATAELGLGDLHVLVTLDGLWAEGDCVDGTVTLELRRPVWADTPWTDIDVHAPKDEAINPALLTEEQKKARAVELKRGAELREGRIAAFFHPGQGKPEWEDLLKAARGNAAALLTFLNRDTDPRREALLRTLTAKDLRDVTDDVLEDHFQHAAPQNNLPDDVYIPYVLCPRVQIELLTPWRGTLSHVLSEEEQAAYCAAPVTLWADLQARMDTTAKRVYAGSITGLVWTPVEAWNSLRCDERSLRILYVALLRTLGVPARLRVLDGMPEFWQDGAFHPVTAQGMGTLILTQLEGPAPLYRQNWTLSRRTPAGWACLTLSDEGWEEGRYTLALPAGLYQLMTSVRLPNGNQFAARRELVLRAGGETTSDLRLRPFALEDLLGCQDLPPMTGCSLDTAPPIPTPVIPEDGRPTLLFWLEEGNEPTEHVLNELSAGQEALQALPVNVVFLVRGRESLEQRTLAGVLDKWPDIQVLEDDWAFDLETVARHLACDPDRPPLAVACNRKGQAVYGVSGYHVGSVELLTRIAAHLVQTEE